MKNNKIQLKINNILCTVFVCKFSKKFYKSFVNESINSAIENVLSWYGIHDVELTEDSFLSNKSLATLFKNLVALFIKKNGPIYDRVYIAKHQKAQICDDIRGIGRNIFSGWNLENGKFVLKKK